MLLVYIVRNWLNFQLNNKSLAGSGLGGAETSRQTGNIERCSEKGEESVIEIKAIFVTFFPIVFDTESQIINLSSKFIKIVFISTKCF